MHKNTLYITFDGLSDPLGQSQILPYLCGIARNGFAITILSCEKKERLNSEFNHIQKTIQDLPIQWQYILYDEQGGILSRLWYIFKIRSMAYKLIREKRISLIHCRSYLASLIGLRYKRKENIPFIFDMRGFWADERLDGGIWKKSNLIHQLLYRYFKRKEKQFLKEAEAIISLTQAGLTVLEKNYSQLAISAKTTVIPCCTNTDLFDRRAISSDLEINGIGKHDHVIIYTGSIGTWYYTREIIDCVLVWKKLIPNLKLLLLSKDQKVLEEILNNYTAEQRKMIITASSTYQDVPKYLALAKAAIFFIKPSYSKIASSPTKMAECWAMDLPIITNPGIGDNDLYFNEHGGGILVQTFTETAYLESAQAYLSRLTSAFSYRNIALRYFDTNRAIHSYSAIYHSLCKQNSIIKY